MCTCACFCGQPKRTGQQRQVVDKRVWRELVSFFPSAVPFRVGSTECLQCLGESTSSYKKEQEVKRQREHEIAPPVLKALFGRKNGVSVEARVCEVIAAEMVDAEMCAFVVGQACNVA